MASGQQQNRGDRKRKKEAPNLKRFRTSILDMVNQKLGLQTNEKELKEKQDDQEKVVLGRPVPRKQRRKNERMLKKARKLAFSQHRKLPTSVDDLHPQNKLKVEEKQRPSGAQRRKKSKEKKKKAGETAKKLKEEKEEQSRIQRLRAQIAEDDKIIKQLSKQMKLNKRKRKNLPAAFIEDGLDFLLDAVDKDKLAATFKAGERDDDDDDDEHVKPKKMRVMQEDSDEEVDMDSDDGDEPSDLEDLISNQLNAESTIEERSENEEDSDNDENNELIEGERSDDDDDDDDDNKDGGNDESEDVVQSNSEASDEEDSVLREDIYGRYVDKKGNVITGKLSGGAYIPPAKRAAMLMCSEKDKVILERLGKCVKGLLNRLSEANLAPISSEIENLYRLNSRALMNQTLLENTKKTILSFSLIPDRLLMVQAMLVAVLHANVDNEIGASILQAYAKEIDNLLRMDDLSSTHKQLDNIITFTCYLYHFKVVSSLLILDILKVLCNQFREKQIEVIMVILKTVGFNLRKDNAAGLKEVIIKVQEKAGNADLTTFVDQSRVRFMLDMLLAIKNNNTRKLPQYDPEGAVHAQKAVSQVTRVTGEAGKLHISFSDLLESESRGAWWRVGSAWSGRTQNITDTAKETPSVDKTEDSTNPDLLELAGAQRMNTDIRRKIFCTIMGSNDYIDCSEKLLRLGLNHRQEQQLVYVLVDCCVQEKFYNPFYSHLAEKLCRTHRRFAVTCQFNIWDRMKSLSKLNPVSINSLAQFLTDLILQGCLSLSLFKVLNLADMGQQKMILTRKVLVAILLESDAKVVEIFSKISQSTKYGQLAISISAFVQHFVMNNFDKLKLDCSRATLERKIDIMERVLAGENRYGL